MKENKIEFKDLSLALKVAVVGSYIVTSLTALGFIAGFFGV